MFRSSSKQLKIRFVPMMNDGSPTQLVNLDNGWDRKQGLQRLSSNHIPTLHLLNLGKHKYALAI